MIARLPAKLSKRVLTVAPTPPEKLAYALARYSRSPDSITDSMEWVRTHDSTKFLESFYFQYGHASIADLGHLAVCFEGVSELAATEIEDEQLWDGQARSSRYQDFSAAEPIVPPELSARETDLYTSGTAALLNTYRAVHERALAYLQEQLPMPADMKPDAYRRNLAARAFDVARYLLPFGIPTGVGQVTSIRTLEKQIRRFRGSEFQELREIGDELAHACSVSPDCTWDSRFQAEPVAPTLARHADADVYASQLRANVSEWARDHIGLPPHSERETVHLSAPQDHVADICATILFPFTSWRYIDLYQQARGWPASRRYDLLTLAFGARARRDELPRHFRAAPYVFEFLIDIGAYRDLHRHRRCQQFRQQYTSEHGYEMPNTIEACGAASVYREALANIDRIIPQLPQPAAQYMLPFAARSRFLFKMDFAELEYISRLRSGVKGHFSYRKVAWDMKQAMDKFDPGLGALIQATPPWVEDPLKR
jgi:thymidylate synthase ThyX